MILNGRELSPMEKLTGTTTLSGIQSSVIKQTYFLLGVSVFCAMVGGYVGATTPAIYGFFGSRIGWIAAMVLLNVVPWIALAARDNPVLGVTALVFDGLLSGVALSPILFIASLYNPTLILAALMVTGAVFLGVTGYVMTANRTFSAPRGLMVGLMVSITAAIVLNMFLNIGLLGILISAGIGIFGVFSLVYSTSTVLNSPEGSSAIPGALMLFAGLFNVFVATLNILLRLFGGGGRRD
jgi:modulator of FtsH protease